MILSGTKAPINGYNMKNWNWLIIAQRDWGDPPDISEVAIVAAETTETDVVDMVEAELLLIVDE